MIYLLLSILSSASMAIALKIFRTQDGNRYAILLGNYLTCILLGFLLLPDKGQAVHGSPATLLCSLAGGFFFVAALVLMQGSIQVNGAVLTAAFSRLGLVIPLLFSTLLLGERPDWLQILGILLVLTAILLINSQTAAENASSGATAGAPLLLLLCLVGSGAGDAMAKVFEQVGPRSEDALYFFWLFAVAAILTTALAWHEYRASGKKMVLREFLAGIAVGIPNYFASALLLRALVHLPAFLVYSCFSTGTILAVALVSAMAFRERPGRRQQLGLAVILAALVLLNL